MCSSMSSSAAVSFSERIDGITRGRRTQARLERIAVDDIDRPVEQTGDVIVEVHVLQDRVAGLGAEFHQYVEIAVGPVVAARDRAEHGGMTDTAGAQVTLVAAQRGNGINGVHHVLEPLYVSLVPRPRLRGAGAASPRSSSARNAWDFEALLAAAHASISSNKLCGNRTVTDLSAATVTGRPTFLGFGLTIFLTVIGKCLTY